MKKIFTLFAVAALATTAFAETKTATIEITAASAGIEAATDDYGQTKTGAGSFSVKAADGNTYEFAYTAAGQNASGNIYMGTYSNFYNVTPINNLKTVAVESYVVSTTTTKSFYVYTGTSQAPTSGTYVTGKNRAGATATAAAGDTYFNLRQQTTSQLTYPKITITFEYEVVPTAVEDVNVAKNAQVRKVIENGRVVIYNGDAKYDMMGARIK